MRYVDAPKGDSVAVTVRMDGVDCPELCPSSEGNNSQCWIAVKAGQALSVLIDLELNASQYQVDLVIDGVVRNIWLATVTPRNDSRKALFEFFEGVHKYYRSLFRSGMYTSRLEHSEDVVFSDTDHTSVGTIEILVYKYDEGFGHLRAAKHPEDLVDWEDLEFQPGSSGIKPTHEVVLTAGARLTDTERRTWKSKTGKVPMGHAPLVTFKILYRHEQALRHSGIVDPRLDVLPTAESVSALTADLLETVHSANSADRIPKAPIGSVCGSQDEGLVTPINFRTGNPYAIRERNGIRMYKLITVNPDHPGPQTNNARGYSKLGPTKRTRQRKTRRSSTIDVDSDSQASYRTSEEAEQETEGITQTPLTKKRRTDVEALRKRVAKMQAELEEAEHLEALEKSKTQQMDRDLEKESSDLAAQQAALERQLKHAKARTESYKKRQTELRKSFDEIAAVRATVPEKYKAAANYNGLLNASFNKDDLVAIGDQENADDGLTNYHHGPETKHNHSARSGHTRGHDIDENSARRNRVTTTYTELDKKMKR